MELRVKAGSSDEDVQLLTRLNRENSEDAAATAANVMIADQLSSCTSRHDGNGRNSSRYLKRLPLAGVMKG